MWGDEGCREEGGKATAVVQLNFFFQVIGVNRDVKNDNEEDDECKEG